MASTPNFYETLGISQDANDEEVKRAYRKLSLKYHPDRNAEPDAQSKFQEINEAYENLGDPARRKQYDMELKFGSQGFNGPPGFTDMADINNIFSMLFGQGGPMGPGGPEIRIFHGGPGGQHPMFHHQTHFIGRPDPIIKQVDLTLEQSYQGCNIPIEVERFVLNNGVKIMENETLYLNIPQGIDDNEMVILKDKGNVVNGQIRSDVKVIFHLINTTEFKRQGLDLIYYKTITLKDALCGFSFELNHINGKRLCLNNMNSPTVIKPDFKKVVPKMGMVRENSIGNMIVEFDIEFPDFLTEDQVKGLAAIL